MFTKPKVQPKYPGNRQAVDGNTAVILCERESSDAAGAYPITPSTQMGEFWSEQVASGHLNIAGRPLVFIEPESEHAAAAVTAGLSMTGMRASNFSSAQGVAFMHESLYAAVGKRLPYILNIGCRAITKASLNVHCAHDDYHCVDDTGFFQVMAASGQEAADLNLIARRTAELALTPGIVAQDGFLTTHLIESMMVPERELIAEFLGCPEDIIDCPTPAQQLVYGPNRRRVPSNWDVDHPVTSGSVQNQDAYMQAVAAQRPFFFAHVAELFETSCAKYAELTGREYGRIACYRTDDAEYLLVGQGSMTVQAQAVADYLRQSRKIKVGVVNLTMYRPFPGDAIAKVLIGKKGVAVLERTDQPLAEDLPLLREIRAALGKCLDNGQAEANAQPYPHYPRVEKLRDLPRLYSGCYGLGSRDLQPEGMIAAIDNMLPNGAHRPFYYLSIDFLHARPESPKQEIYQQQLLEAYPKIGELALRSPDNPNLMPKGSISVRFHSVGGWGAMTTGKNLAMTLFELLGYDIKANPKYGSEKKGQPTTYYLSAAPEPIRMNCEYIFVDVVLSPDPNVFEHSNPLNGLRAGGVFIIQSSLDSPAAVWKQFPMSAQRQIVEQGIRVFYLDGFRIAREEASDPELQFRMQGIAFQGAFFRASPVMEQAGLSETTLFAAIRDQLQSKFGAKGSRVVEDNLRVVRRGFDQLTEITGVQVQDLNNALARRTSTLPILLKQTPPVKTRLGDIHRFWEHTGNFYVAGQGNNNLADPFIAMSMVPAATGIYRDMTQIRFEHPTWVPENCTACGDCYTLCPDSAIPGLVTSVGDMFQTAIHRIERQGRQTQHLRKAVRAVEKRLRTLVEPIGAGAPLASLIDQAIQAELLEGKVEPEHRQALADELGLLEEALGDFAFAITKPYYTTPEKRAKGSGGLFSITVNPYTCKGCMECVEVCDDLALVVDTQTPDTVAKMRKDWAFWLDLPNTPAEYIRIDNLDERIGALETLLLDKTNYGSMVCGDGACIGCGEKTAIHLFTATITALMQPRVREQVARLESLIERLERHVRLRLAESMDLSNTQAINDVVSSHQDRDLTLSELAGRLDVEAKTPLDAEWLRWVTALLDRLRQLHYAYTQGDNGKGRSHLGFINATGCTSVWGSTFPYSPYPFPWTSHLFQDAPSMAMGIFEGHMAKMAEGFRDVRQAEIELAEGYNQEKHGDSFARFNWRDFDDREFLLCPPVVAVGGDGAMYDIGFQNLSRMMMSGMPIKVLVVDTQVYSNTGGQACTSGYISQISDMAPFGPAQHGKSETRKEIALIAMGHRTTYVHQGSISHVTQLLEGYIEGLNSRRPALFNIYAVCQPEHGVADDAARAQSKLAVESRGYPVLRYNPDAGMTVAECLDLSGNPALDADWATFPLSYVDEEGKDATLDLALTFADFAATEGRFRKHFKKISTEKWTDQQVTVSEYLEMDESDRADAQPYIWVTDRKKRLYRSLVSTEMMTSVIERHGLWRMLQHLAGLDGKVDVDAVVEQARRDMAQRLTASLLAMAGSVPSDLGANLMGTPAATGASPAAGGAAPADYEPAWIDSPECTACDDCMAINSKIFVYNADKKAIIGDPRGGTFADIVKAAEKCSAGCIHPGTPWNPNEKGLDKLVKRAEKFN